MKAKGRERLGSSVFEGPERSEEAGEKTLWPHHSSIQRVKCFGLKVSV